MTKATSLVLFGTAVAVCVLAPQLSATQNFYVDPDWAGAKLGTPSAPWATLDTAAWTVIDTALKNESVVVYFSARSSSSDINQRSSAAVNLRRSDQGPNLLTLDGMSFYNANDASPSWVAYSGPSRFEVTSVYPFSTVNDSDGVIRRNWTVRGFIFVALEGQPAFVGSPVNAIFEENRLTASSTCTHGPGLIIAAPQRVFGRNLIIRKNRIERVFGEGLYVAGWYDNPITAPSGQDLLIEENEISDTGYFGGEGDGIDIKDGWTAVVIQGNRVYMTKPATGRDGIISNSAAIIQGNLVYNMGRAGITLDESYSKNDGFWTGTEIRENVVIECGGNPSYSWGRGINQAGMGSVYRFISPKIINNTVVRTKHYIQDEARGIYVGSTTSPGEVRANIIVDSLGPEFEWWGVATAGQHERNLYFGRTSDKILIKFSSGTYTANTIRNYESTALSVDPVFVNSQPPYSREGFAPKPESPVCGLGIGAVMTSQCQACSPTTEPRMLRSN